MVATTAMDMVPQHVSQVDSSAPQPVDMVHQHVTQADTAPQPVDTVLPLPAATVASATSDTDPPQADTVPPPDLAAVATAHTVVTRDPSHPTLTELTEDTVLLPDPSTTVVSTSAAGESSEHSEHSCYQLI